MGAHRARQDSIFVVTTHVVPAAAVLLQTKTVDAAYHAVLETAMSAQYLLTSVHHAPLVICCKMRIAYRPVVRAMWSISSKVLASPVPILAAIAAPPLLPNRVKSATPTCIYTTVFVLKNVPTAHLLMAHRVQLVTNLALSVKQVPLLVPHVKMVKSCTIPPVALRAQQALPSTLLATSVLDV